MESHSFQWGRVCQVMRAPRWGACARFLIFLLLCPSSSRRGSARSAGLRSSGETPSRGDDGRMSLFSLDEVPGAVIRKRVRFRRFSGEGLCFLARCEIRKRACCWSGCALSCFLVEVPGVEIRKRWCCRRVCMSSCFLSEVPAL